MPTRRPASEWTSQKLDALLTQGVADGDARTELLKLAVREVVEEALEAGKIPWRPRGNPQLSSL